MNRPYYLKLMGTPELVDPFGRPVRLRVRKHLALLIYMVLEGRPAYRRDVLIDLLWPGSQSKGSQSLSTSLYILRSALGAGCFRAKKDIAEFVAPPLTTDLERLKSRNLSESECDPSLEIDGVLREFDIPDAPEFQHWADRKRADYLPAVKAGLMRLVGDARRSGNTSSMRSLAERLLDIDSLSEEGTAARMEAAALQGDRLEALRIFETWKRELQEQLHATPSKELESLAMRLRRRSIAVSASPTAGIIERHGERPFIGRNAEYRELFEAWEATNQSRSTHVLLTGESGIGKSTLALRFGGAASMAGAAVARVQCFELEQRIAFGMMGALITELLDRPGASATAPESLAEVGRVVPKVRERFISLPPPRKTEGEAARLHFAEGTFALFDAIMEEQPLVLIIDDYPRSDEASLSVLHLLLRRAENARLMVILTARPPQPDEPPQAARVRRAMQHVPVRKIQLDALTEPEGEELFQHIVGGTGKLPAAPERRAILRAAAGNPMALELLVRDWLAHPDAPLGLLLTAMRSEVKGAALGAEDYDQLIERILPALSARHRVALFLSVILGPRLNDFQYFTFLDLTPPQVMAALSELVEYRILRSTESGMEFVNEVMRARLYLNIPVATRIRLHDGVATLLIDAMGRGESVSRLEIAWHCIRAKRRDEAAPHLIIGSRQSLEKGAPDEAARALSSALRELKGHVRQEAFILLAESFDELGDPRAVLDVVEELKATKPADPHVVEMAEELEIEARYRLGLLSKQEAVGIIRDFIGSFRNRSTQGGKAKAALISVRVARDFCDSELFEDLRQAIVRLPTDSFEPKERAMALMAEALNAFHQRDTSTANKVAKLACDVLLESGNHNTSLVSLNMGLGALAIAEGEYAEAIEPLQHAAELARKLGNDGYQVMAAGNLAVSYYRLGRYEEQHRWASLATSTRGVWIEPFDRVKIIWLLGMAQIYLQRLGEAEESIRMIVAEYQRAEAEWIIQFGKYSLSEMHWRLGRRSTALEIAAEASRNGLAGIALTGLYARWSALVSVKSGDAETQLVRLLRLRETRDRLDALDRAELDCAVVFLRRHLSLPIEAFLADMDAGISRLPPACREHFFSSGILMANS